mgnify:CR=1 FL=1
MTATPSPKPILLVPLGSSGDVNPFLWMGKILQAHGHRVRILANSHFDSAARMAGVELVPIGSREEYEAMIQDPVVWHPRRGTPYVLRSASSLAIRYFERIRDLTRDEPDTLLIGSALAFGARLAREKLGLKLLSAHLQPSLFRSLHRTPTYSRGTAWLDRSPIWVKKLAFHVMDRVIARHTLPQLRAACRQEGVAAPGRVFREWWHSPDGVLALFPEWFGPSQPDWPSPVHHLGFPLYDLGEEPIRDRELLEFLDSGPAPVLFTPGSAMAHGHRFFETALKSCQELGRRAVFATNHPEQLPPKLPASVFACRYVPFSRLMPRVALAVHHGGIGTLSQALLAGIPQICMPLSHDQPDNAVRLETLGVGVGIPPRTFTMPKVSKAMDSLLNSSEVAQRCQESSRRLVEERDSSLPESRLPAAIQRTV